jgi:hypothetical protein
VVVPVVLLVIPIVQVMLVVQVVVVELIVQVRLQDDLVVQAILRQ